jgi:S1-C subfamily serine protease
VTPAIITVIQITQYLTNKNTLQSIEQFYIIALKKVLMKKTITILFYLITLLFVTSVNAQTDNIKVYQQASDTIFMVKSNNVVTGINYTHGSGALISNKGLLVTNFHVVADVVKTQYLLQNASPLAIKHHSPRDKALELIVEHKSGDFHYKANIVKVDIEKDIALLQLINYQEKITPLSFAKQTPSLGENIYSMGNPMHLGLVIEEGIYNGKSKDPRYLHSDYRIFYGNINGGMSGGAVLNNAAEIIGINAATFGSGMGLFVGADNIEHLIKEGQPFNLNNTYHSYLLVDNNGFQFLANESMTSVVYKGRNIPLINADYCSLDNPSVIYSVQCNTTKYTYTHRVYSLDSTSNETNFTTSTKGIIRINDSTIMNIHIQKKVYDHQSTVYFYEKIKEISLGTTYVNVTMHQMINEKEYSVTTVRLNLQKENMSALFDLLLTKFMVT